MSFDYSCCICLDNNVVGLGYFTFKKVSWYMGITCYFQPRHCLHLKLFSSQICFIFSLVENNLRLEANIIRNYTSNLTTPHCYYVHVSTNSHLSYQALSNRSKLSLLICQIVIPGLLIIFILSRKTLRFKLHFFLITG